jgi:M6 family metalloprotease-like protein
MNINNLKVNTYACGSELGGSENVTSGIGTLCHEFTHCLGIPDFYDTASGDNFGMGKWDVMCSGSYNGNSFCPAGFTSYEKMWCGWLTPTELTADATIDNLKPLSDGGGAYIIYNDNHKD